MPKPLYVLEGTLYRNIRTKSSDLINIREEFVSENPIIARTKAFKKFQCYIDVLLESQGFYFKSHQQACQYLTPFIDSGEKKYFRNIPDLEIETDFDKGLFIYFIPTPENKTYTIEGNVIYMNKYCVHYIDNNLNIIKPQVLNSLIFEHNFYKEHQFSTNNQHCWIYKYGKTENVKKISIIHSPIADIFD